jgi:RNA polymerase sigma-70 factor (ECF subfamily)
MISLRANRLLQKHYEALSPRLYRLAWSWTHDRDSAQDLVQETWAKAFERSRQLQDEARLQAWLSRIMVNLYRDQLRAAREHLDIGGLELAHDQDTDSQAGKQDEIERVRRAVARLPHDQRMVLTLVDLMELSYAQVSETLDVPIGTVMSRLSRSRNRLKQLLQEDAAPARIRRIK